MDTHLHNNALINETSPYLQQHAHNPVYWYPWSEEALARAREEDKPILLSIGYSACHWCHVMAHESFEDEDTAAIMNEHFINIKVDREERPDLDKIYQTAQQLLTRRTGGWPLTMFLTPADHIPFFGGTYFPPDSRYGLPGFRDVLLRIVEYYQKERLAIARQNESVQEALQRIASASTTGAGVELTAAPLGAATAQLEQSFDPRYGGFGGAPKFPHPTSIERLLRYLRHASDDERRNILSVAETTLQKMARGGVYDQLGGGFYRYSVDERWMIPHFEKMLYDNGPLLTLYCDAWQITNNNLYKTIVLETAEWVLRDMQSGEGGYFSTIDADSEGHEGKFYIWDRDEIRSLLNDQEYAVAEKYFGLDQPPNFEGQWHLHVVSEPEQVAALLSLDVGEVIATLTAARHKLLEVRRQRIWPQRDEKILSSWNGLMIKGMATVAVTFDQPRYFESAAKALEFIQKTMWKDGRLLATCKDGNAHLNAYLDDYAFLADAILVLLNFHWRTDWLEFAVQLADTLLDLFEDKEHGGMFFTSHDHEQLIQRTKTYMDDSLPAGNGIAASALMQLGHLLGEHRYLQAAGRILKSGQDSVTQFPAAHNAMLNALEDHLYPPRQIIIRGNENEIRQWQQHCRQLAGPYCMIFPVENDVQGLPDAIATKKPGEQTIAYVCEGLKCSAPITRLDLMNENLNNQKQ